MGLQHFTGTPTIDQLGDEVVSYPGETLMPYTHWANIRGEDERWKFLAEHNAIPNKIENSEIIIEGDGGLEYRALEQDELYEFSVLAGRYFSIDLGNYMKDTDKVTNRSVDRIVEKDSKRREIIVTGVQSDIKNMRNKAIDDARTAMFYWGLVKEDMPKEWAVIEKNKAYMPYRSSKKIGDITLTKDQLYRYNTLATTIYAPMAAEYLQSDAVKYDKAEPPDEETGMTPYDEEIKALWEDALLDAEDLIEDIMWVEQEK
jgi:hypothetical protein